MLHIDLFAGIGGFSLGLERAGHETIAFCEIDPYCQKVLNKHWPNIPIHDDIQTFTYPEFDGVVTAGFPCQDISCAGKREGIDGERSGLWSELARVLGELRPRYAILENVSALLSGDRGRWFGRVLGDLAAIGYDCEWHCIPASHLGAPHRRDRVWIVAYTKSNRQRPRIQRQPIVLDRTETRRNASKRSTEVANTSSERRQQNTRSTYGDEISYAGWATQINHIIESNGQSDGWWQSEPNVGRVANGVPARVHRLRCLGNAIVPQMAELIGNAIQSDIIIDS